MKLPNETPITSNQDALNRVYKHFILDKNPQCSDIKGECMYRINDNGCAIGCMLPDNLISIIDAKCIELKYASISVNGIQQNNLTEVLEWIKGADISFLQELQSWHDCFFGSLDKLYEIANKHKLTLIPI